MPVATIYKKVEKGCVENLQGRLHLSTEENILGILSVLRIQIRSDPHNFTGSGSVPIQGLPIWIQILTILSKVHKKLQNFF